MTNSPGWIKKPEMLEPVVRPPVDGPAIPKPAATKPANMEATCPARGVFQAVDLSEPCTQRFLDTMKYLGIKTIIRYYDYQHETLRGKTPQASELALIKKNGFTFLAVFQHSNNSMATFNDLTRGEVDAKRSLELAHQWGQPKGSAIYFGVDFDPGLGHEIDAVKLYAKRFGDAVRTAGYRVGAYGSGFTLRNLLDAGLIDLSWLSMSTGFRESKTFEANMRWNLHQVKDMNCGGINCDFDYVNPAKPDFGQWEIS